ncbi:hypothetical protein AB0333_02430 [Citricoccus sp. NPDC079358]|uniref:hypothetical protein n=1 Tax=Citricoccus sp. NPDC079358 TaxID=3154653 RepID=UPI00344BAB3A
MSTLSIVSPLPRIGVLRSGLVLASVLGALDIATGVMALFGGFFAPPEVGIVMIVLGVATVALMPFSWSGGHRWPAWTAVALRLLSSTAGLPAFFVVGAPVAGVVLAAVGILLAVLCAALVAYGFGGTRR